MDVCNSLGAGFSSDMGHNFSGKRDRTKDQIKRSNDSLEGGHNESPQRHQTNQVA